jgi:hypothetical protein
MIGQRRIGQVKVPRKIPIKKHRFDSSLVWNSDSGLAIPNGYHCALHYVDGGVYWGKSQSVIRTDTEVVIF